jgi:hypothetical protein
VTQEILSPSPTPTPTQTPTPTPTPTPDGDGDDNGGDVLPVWTIIVIVFGALLSIGLFIAFLMKRTSDKKNQATKKRILARSKK